jgi:hypothetical protein
VLLRQVMQLIARAGPVDKGDFWHVQPGNA